MPTSTAPDAPHADPAVALISRLAADGHAYLGIAAALNRAGIRTQSGRGMWAKGTVFKLAKTNGIKVSYSPGKIRAAQERDAASPPPVVAAEPAPAPKPVYWITTFYENIDAAVEARAADIDQCAAELGIHRWLVEDAVYVWENTLSHLACSIESGPHEPDAATGPNAHDLDKMARKQAQHAHQCVIEEDADMRGRIAGRAGVDAVETMFVWHAGQRDFNAALDKVLAELEAAKATPDRLTLWARYRARGKLYRTPDASHAATTGALAAQAERFVRARLVAQEQAAEDYLTLLRLPGMLHDDLLEGLGKERGSTGHAARCVEAAKRSLRHWSRLVEKHGPDATVTAIRALEKAERHQNQKNAADQ